MGSRSIQLVPITFNNCRSVVTDWNDFNQIEDLLSEHDIVIHTAGMSAEDCTKDPIASFEFNCIGTMKLIEACKSQAKKKFIYLSTAHIYGSPLIGKLTEDSIPRNNHPYATSHLAGEFGINYANSKGEIEGYNLRLSNGFGAPISENANCWNLFVNDLCRQAITKREIIIRTNEEQQRDFIPITNIVQTIEMIINEKKVLPFNTLNVGSGSSLTLLDMAKKIQTRTNHLFQFSPIIKTNEKAKSTKENFLEYNVDRLKSLDLFKRVDLDMELDSLLLYCHKKFSAPPI